MKKNKIKLGIVGHGFVGKATDSGFACNVEKFIVDPLYQTSVRELKSFKPDIVFICVPTPMSKDGDQDSSIITNVITELMKYCPEVVKVVKSTVVPSVLENIEKVEPNIVYNPEFLREKHANSDFINSDMIIFGGKKDACDIVSNAYLNHSLCKTKEHIFLSLKAASLVKYTINSFLASKVVFFNELYAIYEQLDLTDDWNNIISTISNDERIGCSHMDVPGHDGRKGFGGACFPKDTLALVKYADSLDVDMSLLKSAIRKNNSIRNQYSNLDDREVEQNVSFDDKI